MENRFAGAQDHGNRRRRWLSQEEDASADSEFDFPQNPVENEHPAERVTDSLMRGAVSSRIWMIALVIAASTLFCTSLICRSEDTHRRFGTEQVAHLPSDIKTRFSGMLLLFAAGYALLTGWIRGTSTVDFKGRYRCWRWMAGYLAGIGIVQILGVGPLLPSLLSQLLTPITGPIQAARPAIIFAISVTLSAILLSRVLPDMGRCVWSQATLTAAVLIVIVRFMLQHSAHGEVQTATLDALLLLAANTTFAATLMHCHFVAYVDNAPPVSSLPTGQQSAQPNDATAAESTTIADDIDANLSNLRPTKAPSTKTTSTKATATERPSADQPSPVSPSAADGQEPPSAEVAQDNRPPTKSRRRKSKRKRKAA